MCISSGDMATGSWNDQFYYLLLLIWSYEKFREIELFNFTNFFALFSNQTPLLQLWTDEHLGNAVNSLTGSKELIVMYTQNKKMASLVQL